MHTKNYQFWKKGKGSELESQRKPNWHKPKYIKRENQSVVRKTPKTFQPFISKCQEQSESSGKTTKKGHGNWITNVLSAATWQKLYNDRAIKLKHRFHDCCLQGRFNHPGQSEQEPESETDVTENQIQCLKAREHDSYTRLLRGPKRRWAQDPRGSRDRQDIDQVQVHLHDSVVGYVAQEPPESQSKNNSKTYSKINNVWFICTQEKIIIYFL